jgi:CubicO group peptidase (beta-lactamase class C family)
VDVWTKDDDQRSSIRPSLPTSTLALALLLLIAPLARPAAAQPAGAVFTDQIDALFDAWDTPTSPGAALAVLKDDEVIYKRGYGMANLTYDIPITASTVFDIASVSKQFCAFAIAMLAEQGALSDDDVRTYLPEMPDFGTPITLRHLVHHTSGLRDWPGTLAMAGWEMEDVISFDQILTMVRYQQDLNFEPGADYSYSNTGYNLLAEVVARVTGQSFRAWTDAHLFKPLGMVHTHFHDDHEEVVKNRAYAYSPSRDGFKHVGNGLTALGSSSLFTTIDDLILWVQNFREPRVGGPAVLAQVHEQGVLNDGTVISYAFGQSIDTYRGLKTVAHSGSWAGFRTRLVRFPDQDFAVIVLSNASNFDPTGKAWQVADLYLADQLEPVPAAAPLEPVAVDPAVLDAYVGTYQLGPGWFVTITREGEQLTTQATNEPRFEMTPTSETRFFVEAYGAAIDFKKDVSGAVTHIEYRDIHAPRVELVEPSASELAAFEGAYHSDELGTTYTLVVEDGVLRAYHRRHDTATLSPTTADTFTTDAWFMPSIHFVRDSARRVTGFEASNSRSRNVRFARVR